MDEIARQAAMLKLPEEKQQVQVFVKLGRERGRNADKTLPYERMEPDHPLHGKAGFSVTNGCGEAALPEDRDFVIVSLTGFDDRGAFTASDRSAVEGFFSGEGNWLEEAAGTTLWHGKIYDE